MESNISIFRHLNIVSIYGVAVDQQPPFLLLELITGGSLIGFLKKVKSS